MNDLEQVAPEKSYFLARLEEQIDEIIVKHTVVLVTSDASQIQAALERLLLSWRGPGRWADEVIKNHVITAQNTGLRSASCGEITYSDAVVLVDYLGFFEA